MDYASMSAEAFDICAVERYLCAAQDGSCDLSVVRSAPPQRGVVRCTDASPHSEQTLKSAVEQQLVFIAIEHLSSIQPCSSGVLTAPCGTRLEHGVSPNTESMQCGLGAMWNVSVVVRKKNLPSAQRSTPCGREGAVSKKTAPALAGMYCRQN